MCIVDIVMVSCRKEEKLIMAKPKIFVSFDFENDRNYKYTLNMWNANSSFEFTCNDKSPSEIQSWNIPTVKSVLSRKINEATHVVVIVGKELPV